MGVPMAVIYDRTIIHAGVERLYARANTRIATYTLLGIGIGLSIGYVLAGLLGEMGFSIGRERAFVLRLRAQTALCHLKIEENTRAASAVPVPDSGTVEAAA